MEKSPVQWSDLPPELWELIGNQLETEIDIIRFRSVCSSWRRASLPPINAVCPNLLTLNDFPFVSWLNWSFPVPRPSCYGGIGTSLRRKTIFHIIPLRPNFGNKKQGGKLKFMELFSSLLMYNNEAALGKEGKLNLLDFRIYKVAESYNTEHPSCLPNATACKSIYPHNFNISSCKIIIPPNFDFRNNATIVGISQGRLMFAKHGDDLWTSMERSFVAYMRHMDVIVYKKKIYAVNEMGQISRIDYSCSMEVVLLDVPPCGFGRRKHLVECGGELYVVNAALQYWGSRRAPTQVIDFEVLRLELLDEDEGRWVDVENLGNYSFVLKRDCSFSVDEGLQPNCIYFNHDDDDLTHEGHYRRMAYNVTALFDLKQRSFINLV